MTLRTLNYGNYGIFLIMGNAGFCPSTVWGLGFCYRVQGLGICSDLEKVDIVLGLIGFIKAAGRGRLRLWG